MIQTGLTGCPLDRADAIRNDPAAIAAAREDPAARVLRLGTDEPATTVDGGLPWEPLGRQDMAEDAVILLGFDAGAPRFVAMHGGLGGTMRSPGMARLLATWPTGVAATWGMARTLVDWHGRHRFCANCGQPTAPFRAGWARACGACRTEHFPRVDPVVIMLAEHDGHVLVGQGKGWGARRGSALAGFVEPGESVEEAVAREILEETGVRVDDVRYATSQPWPFPGQLMIACFAWATDPTITVDTNELDDAFWIDRAGIAAMLAGDPAAPFDGPPPYAIAHTLFRLWLDGSGIDGPGRA